MVEEQREAIRECERGRKEKRGREVLLEVMAQSSLRVGFKHFGISMRVVNENQIPSSNTVSNISQ
ncbi:hypothetical protein E2C01_050547 [Portunus trituberculatus]|uniref:Uncharacterized protein n=1 Tax=Portunus trituberculatus TaxID=210409 RepID=A0A5B7GGT2_PORTR|nr:hypothetical protein [Portunus trituberculatus]